MVTETETVHSYKKLGLANEMSLFLAVVGVLCAPPWPLYVFERTLLSRRRCCILGVYRTI